MADLLDSLLQDGGLHVVVELLILASFLLPFHESENASVLHLVLGCGTRGILRDLLDDFEHTLQRVQYKSVRGVAEVDGRECEHYDHPDSSGQVDRGVLFSFSLYAESYRKFKATRCAL